MDSVTHLSIPSLPWYSLPLPPSLPSSPSFSPTSLSFLVLKMHGIKDRTSCILNTLSTVKQRPQPSHLFLNYIYSTTQISPAWFRLTVSFPKSYIKIFLYIERGLRRVPCSLGYPQTYYVAEVGLELLILLLSIFVPLSMACFFNIFLFVNWCRVSICRSGLALNCGKSS